MNFTDKLDSHALRLVDLKEEVMRHYSSGSRVKCTHCGNIDIRVLSLDHINLDGAAHRRSLGVKGGTAFYAKLKALGFPQTPPLQVLCFNCHALQEWERDHGREQRRARKINKLTKNPVIPDIIDLAMAELP